MLPTLPHYAARVHKNRRFTAVGYELFSIVMLYYAAFACTLKATS